MKYASIEWRDGQPYSNDYDDIYYSRDDGLAESEYVFISQNLPPENLRNLSQCVIFEIGFGSGLNFVLTVRHWLKHAQADSVLYYIAVENRPLIPADLARASTIWPALQPYYKEWLDAYPLPVPGQHNLSLFNGRVQLQLLYRDALEALCDFDYKVDAWYLDGFAPAKNPECWSRALFNEMARCSKSGTRLSSYTSAGAVVRALKAAGFDVEKIAGHGRKRQIITACFNGDNRQTNVPPWYRLPDVCVNTNSAVVLGSGLAGLTVAWSLIQRGWRITVVDRHEQVAAQASGNPAGLLLPRLSVGDSVDAMFYSNAFLYAVSRLDDLQRLSNSAIWFSRGVYTVYDNAKAHALLQQYRHAPRFISPADDHATGLIDCSDGRAVLYIEQAGCVSPEAICEAIVTACGDKIDFVQADIRQLKRAGQQWCLLDDRRQPVLSSEIVVLANSTGVSSFDITGWLPVQASRGQMTQLKASDRSRVLTHALSADRYITPECHGVHYTGASYSYRDVSLILNEQDDISNIEHINKLMPGLFQQSDITGGRVSLRAVSKDRVPIAGPVPDQETFISQYHDLHHGRHADSYAPAAYLPGLYVSVAHGSRGITSSFLCAEIIAAMLNSQPLPVGRHVIQYLSAARFLVRALRRGPILSETR